MTYFNFHILLEVLGIEGGVYLQVLTSVGGVSILLEKKFYCNTARISAEVGLTTDGKLLRGMYSPFTTIYIFPPDIVLLQVQQDAFTRVSRFATFHTTVLPVSKIDSISSDVSEIVCCVSVVD